MTKYRFKNLKKSRSFLLRSPQNFRRISGIRKRKILEDLKHAEIESFFKTYKQEFNIKHVISEKSLSYIPSTGGTVVLANNASGIADGVLILETILSIRNDVKIIKHDMVPSPMCLNNHIIVISEHQDKSKNIVNLKSAQQWIQQGHCLIMFSNTPDNALQFLHKNTTHPFWNDSIKRFLQISKAPILPWAINAKNGVIKTGLSTLGIGINYNLINKEALRKRLRPIYSKVGKPFKINDEVKIQDLEMKIRLMSYRNLLKYSKINPTIFNPKISRPIIEAVPKNKLEKDVNTLGNYISAKNEFKLYCFKGENCPNILREIGRLRELTFRAVNEGSGNEIDLDSHDRYFEHLFIWDNETSNIVGAYRLGFGPDLSKIDGYNSILFEFYKKNSVTQDLVDCSLLMGRAFVAAEYQSKPFPLFMLWEGIKTLVSKRNDIKYILGQTSLPSTFQKYSKQLIVSYLIKHHSDLELSQHLKPYNKYRFVPNPIIQKWVLQSSSGDIKRMDSIVECIENNGSKTPMLFRRYIEQGAKCIGVNIDPDFQNSIDILMLTKIH
ncbi:MAG: lysophospholipid acyltransferase family protein [Bacteroidia bacterium]